MTEQETPTPAKISKYALEGYGFTSPVYCNHKRGNNWVAICKGKNAANVEHQFLKHSGAIFDLEGVKANDVLTVAGDYTTSCGNKYRDRLFFRVVAITEERLEVEKFDTLSQAMKAARAVEKGGAQ